jgi:hypothetical protein
MSKEEAKKTLTNKIPISFKFIKTGKFNKI